MFIAAKYPYFADGVEGTFVGHASICLSFNSRSRSVVYSIACTAESFPIACTAAVAADWPSTMNTGSMRIEP